MRARNLRAAAFAVATAILAGCDDPAGCPLGEFPGVVLEIRDSVTGAGLADQALVVATATSGSTTDTLRWIDGPDSVFISGLYDQPGSFTLSVSVPGYQDWDRADVLVERGRCVVNTVEIQALLQAP